MHNEQQDWVQIQYKNVKYGVRILRNTFQAKEVPKDLGGYSFHWENPPQKLENSRSQQQMTQPYISKLY